MDQTTDALEIRSRVGMPHQGRYAVYLRVSTDKQDVESQRVAVERYLNGGKHIIRYFEDPDSSGGLLMHQRKVMRKTIAYCKRYNATLVVATLSRLSRTMWETQQFFQEEVLSKKIDLIVADNPTISENPMYFSMAAFLSQSERERIRANTRAGMARIKHEIATKGYYMTKEIRSGGKVIKKSRKIKKLGVHHKTKEASKAGGAATKRWADEYALWAYPFITPYLKKDLSWREIGAKLETKKIRGFWSDPQQIGVPTSKLWIAKQKGAYEEKAPSIVWHPTTVMNVLARAERLLKKSKAKQIKKLDFFNERGVL